MSLWAAGSTGCELLDRQPEDMSSEAHAGIRVVSPAVKPEGATKQREKPTPEARSEAVPEVRPAQPIRLVSSVEPPTRYVLRTPAVTPANAAVPADAAAPATAAVTTNTTVQVEPPTRYVLRGPAGGAREGVAQPPAAAAAVPTVQAGAAEQTVVPAQPAVTKLPELLKVAPPKGDEARPGKAADAVAAPPFVSQAGKHQPIDLALALHLAGTDNPNIALAWEAVQASQALLLQAQALTLPTVNAGLTIDSHTGNLLSSMGIIRNLKRQSGYAGLGAGALGAGAVPIPGVRALFQVADAVYEPRVARQVVAARRFDAMAERNNVLLDVVVTYLDWLGAQAYLTALRKSEEEFAAVAKLTSNFATAGQGRQGDADRAAAELELLRQQRQQAEGEVNVAAARLARLLSLDPTVAFTAHEPMLLPVTLVAPEQSMEALLNVAVDNRPEMRARAADIEASRARLREEQCRPFLPLISLGYSMGTFGGGSNLVGYSFNNFAYRNDFDAWAVWTLQNLGFGNIALQRRMRALVNESEVERARVLDEVRREVATAYDLSAARYQQVLLAGKRVQVTEEGYQLDLRRARNLAGRPIELLNSLNLLNAARRDLVSSLVGYNQAQIRLFVALGQPPALTLDLRSCAVVPPQPQ